MSAGQLRRIRWAVRGVLVLGVAASVAANILHARPHPVAQAIAAWPPVALLITVELISRVPVHRRILAAVRLIATTAIAAIAAQVSYVHMTGVAARYGETGAAPYLIPLSVDGLVVVASVSLVELAGRIRATGDQGLTPESPPVPEVQPVPLPPVDPVPVLVEPGPPAAVLPEAAAEPDSAPGVPNREPTLASAEGPAKPTKPARTSAPRRPFAVTQRAAAAMEAGGLSIGQIAVALNITERQVRAALKPVPVSDRHEP